MKLRFSHIQIIVAGYLSIVFAGTVLLLLPLALHLVSGGWGPVKPWGSLRICLQDGKDWQ